MGYNWETPSGLFVQGHADQDLDRTPSKQILRIEYGFLGLRYLPTDRRKTGSIFRIRYTDVSLIDSWVDFQNPVRLVFHERYV